MGVLPKPEDLQKKQKATAIDHARDRVLELAKTENILSREINQLRDTLTKIKDSFHDKETKMTEAHKAFVSCLREEIEALEARKQAALAKIVDRTPEFNAREKELGERSDLLLEAFEGIEITKKDLKATSKAVEANYEQSEKHLEASKQLEIDNGAERVKIQTEKEELEKEKLAYKKRVEKQKKSIRQKREIMEGEAISLSAREDLLLKTRKELEDKDRQLRHAYAQLEKTKKKVLAS